MKFAISRQIFHKYSLFRKGHYLICMLRTSLGPILDLLYNFYVHKYVNGWCAIIVHASLANSSTSN